MYAQARPERIARPNPHNLGNLDLNADIDKGADGRMKRAVSAVAICPLVLVLPRQSVYPWTPDLLTFHIESTAAFECIKRRGIRTRNGQVYGVSRDVHYHIFLFASGVSLKHLIRDVNGLMEQPNSHHQQVITIAGEVWTQLIVMHIIF